MRKLVITMAALSLVACNKSAPAVNDTAANDMAAINDMMTANDTTGNDAMAGNGAMADNGAMAGNAMATPAAFEIKGTSWEYKDTKGRPIQESVGADGNYVSHSGATHIDHGMAMMKDGKACFTSAMDKKGPSCWTTSQVAIGSSMNTVSDKGEKLTVNRVAYVPPKM